MTEAFLSNILGGRAEPIGDAFKGSSVKIIEGAGEIAELRAAHVDGE